jgi:nucleoid DNA-binding protein
MKPKFQKMNTLSRKIATKVGLNAYDVDAILKTASYEIVEILKKEQKFYWDGLGVFYVTIKDNGLSVRLKLSEEPYNRLNEKKGERSDEIIFE